MQVIEQVSRTKFDQTFEDKKDVHPIIPLLIQFCLWKDEIQNDKVVKLDDKPFVILTVVVFYWDFESYKP